VLRYAIHFFFAVRKSNYFQGVPCVFLRVGLVPGLVLVLEPGAIRSRLLGILCTFWPFPVLKPGPGPCAVSCPPVPMIFILEIFAGVLRDAPDNIYESK
jgi:hypothetical protein